MTLQTLQTRVVSGMNVSFFNEQEFNQIYDDIFKYDEWRFVANTSTPLILDCGAHIGMSVLYFKKLYPRAKIIAFEANPQTFKLLELNVRQNNLSDVKLVNAAVANTTEAMDFYIFEETSDSTLWTWGNAGVKNSWYDPKTYKTIQVPTIKLSSYINEKVDFVKIDIEGMEEQVLRELEGKLVYIEQLAMEFHGSSTNLSNSAERIISLLRKNKYKYGVTQGKKVIKIERADKTDPYFLMLYASKKRSILWWHIYVLQNMNRIYRRAGV